MATAKEVGTALDKPDKVDHRQNGDDRRIQESDNPSLIDRMFRISVLLYGTYIIILCPKTQDYKNCAENTFRNFKQRNKTDEKCKLCKKKGVITTYCSFCNRFYDDPCQYFHTQMCMYLNHTTIPINDVNSTILDFAPKIICKNPKHQHLELHQRWHEKHFYHIKYGQHLCLEDIDDLSHDILDLHKPTDLIEFLKILLKKCDLPMNGLMQRLTVEVKRVLEYCDKMIIDGVESIEPGKWNEMVYTLVDIENKAKLNENPRRCPISHPVDD